MIDFICYWSGRTARVFAPYTAIYKSPAVRFIQLNNIVICVGSLRLRTKVRAMSKVNTARSTAAMRVWSPMMSIPLQIISRINARVTMTEAKGSPASVDIPTTYIKLSEPGIFPVALKRKLIARKHRATSGAQCSNNGTYDEKIIGLNFRDRESRWLLHQSNR